MATPKLASIRILVISIIAINFIVLIAFPLVFSHLSAPRIIDLAVTRSQKHAIQISNYITSDLNFVALNNQSGAMVCNSFNLYKIKQFNHLGTTIYSTDSSDLGVLNSHDYFRREVMNGQVVSKYVQKDMKSLEGVPVTLDVVETYVPLMKEGTFLGAIEIYCVVSQELAGSFAILHGARTIFLVLGFGLISFLVYFGIRFIRLESSLVYSYDERSVESDGQFKPVKSFLTMILFIGVAEFVTMISIHQLEMPILISSLLDAFVLTIILTPVLYFGVFRSLLTAVTVLAQRDRSLEESRDIAERANSAKTRFLANMTHELRTPMNAVVGMSHILERTELNEEQLDCVDTILSSGEVLLSVVNNILDIAKIEAGKLVLESAEFDIRTLVEDTVHILSVIAHEKGIHIESVIDHSITSTVVGDPMRLKQVLINLGNNAVKFTKQGRVEINLSLVQKENDVEMIEFRVTDTGIGIAPHLRDHIFNPFTQADESTARQFGGSGLGLTISSQFVELMGGSIQIIDLPQWSTAVSFTLQLPVLKDENSATVEHLIGKTALVITDTPHYENGTVELLRFWGLSVDCITACTGDPSELIARVNAHLSADVIFIDSTRACGSCVCRTGFILEKIRWKTLPYVVILNNHTHVCGMFFSEQHGHVGKINKPYRHNDLKRLIDPIFGASNASVLRDESSAEEATVFSVRKDIKIAIVDDNPTNLRVACRALEKIGFSPKMYESGEEIIDAVIEIQPDIIFMDIHMPILDGFQTTAIIREMEKSGKWEPIPIIALTAAIIDLENSAENKSLFNGVVIKPFNLNDLQDRIEQVLRAKSTSK